MAKYDWLQEQFYLTSKIQMRLGEGAMSISSLGFAISRPTSTSSSSSLSSYKDLASSHIFGLTKSSFLWSKNKPHHTNPNLKQKLCVRDSAQENSQKLEEDSKFVPLDPEDPRFGPPVSFFHPFKSLYTVQGCDYIFSCRFCCCLAFNFMKHKR